MSDVKFGTGSKLINRYSCTMLNVITQKYHGTFCKVTFRSPITLKGEFLL